MLVYPAEMPAPVIIVEHQDRWAVDFAALRDLLAECLGLLAHSIEHVGSTSVLGLAAKPIIDLIVVIERDRSAHDPVPSNWPSPRQLASGAADWVTVSSSRLATSKKSAPEELPDVEKTYPAYTNR
jgi:GrpB-like predicted nucleotidyltransferase (UPF0157 family)